MPTVAAWHIKSAVVYLIIGLAMGVGMGMSHDHTLMQAHAHLNLIGWASMALFGVYYALQPAKAAGRLPRIQFSVSTLGVWVMIPGLAALFYGEPIGEPLAALGSLIVLLGAVLFAIVVFRR